MINNLLEIKNLSVSINNKVILKNFNLLIQQNQVHAIMGPNGSGKSTLSKVLVGNSNYKIINGEIIYKNQNLLLDSPEERAQKGIFLSFQYPLEINGLSNFDFLHLIYNEKLKYEKKKEIDPLKFLELLRFWMQKLKFSDDFLNRNVNENFSGGEKKKNEILQILLLQPKLIILDELDSGLDMDALKNVCEILQTYLPKTTSYILITHYLKFLNYFKPNLVYILINGETKKIDSINILNSLEQYGFQNYF